MNAEELFNKNNKLVHYVIHEKFQGFQTIIPGHEYEDIVQVGNIGLWKACISFDESKKISFSTYAIKCIINEILLSLRKEKNKLINNYTSLDDVISDEEGKETKLYDIIAIEQNNCLSISELRIYISNLYKNSERNYNIIYSYIFECMSQREIGRKYGYSQPHISRIIKEFKQKLKKHIERNGSL